MITFAVFVKTRLIGIIFYCALKSSLRRLTIFSKALKYEIQKPSTCCATLFRCKFPAMFPVFHLAWSTCCATKTYVSRLRQLLRKVECGSTLSNKFWLCCSFFIKLTTCHATNNNNNNKNNNNNYNNNG